MNRETNLRLVESRHELKLKPITTCIDAVYPHISPTLTLMSSTSSFEGTDVYPATSSTPIPGGVDDTSSELQVPVTLLLNSLELKGYLLATVWTWSDT